MKEKEILLLITGFLLVSGFVASVEQIPFIPMPRLDDNIDINIDADINIGEPAQIIEPTIALEEVYEKLKEVLLNRGIIEESTLFYNQWLEEIELTDTTELGHRRLNEEENIWYPVYVGGFVLKKEKNSAMTYEEWHWEFNGLTGESNYLKKFGETTFQNIKTKEQAIELLKREMPLSEEGIRVMPYYYPTDVPMWRAYFGSKIYHIYDDGNVEGPTIAEPLSTIEDYKSAPKSKKEEDYNVVFLIAFGIGLIITTMILIWLVKRK